MRSRLRRYAGARGNVVTEQFLLRYDGPALTEHRMPVNELAPALIAMSELFMVAHRISDGAALPPSLDVRANREGSFAVELVLTPNDVVDLLSQREAIAAATAVTLLGPVVGALAWLQGRRKNGGKTAETVSEVRPGVLSVKWNADGSTEVFTTSAARDLVEDMDFRRTAAAATGPLRQDRGIDTVEIRPTGESAEIPSITLDRDDAVALDAPPLDGDSRVLSDITRTVSLRPLKPALQTGFKWFVSDGSARFWVTIHDLEFLQRVESSVESFSAGDILRCQMRERQLEDASSGDLKMERTVLEVIEHRRWPPPDGFEFDKSGEMT